MDLNPWPTCGLLLSSPKFEPILTPLKNLKFPPPNILAIGGDHIHTASHKRLRFLHSFATNSTSLSATRNDPSSFPSHCFSAVLPVDSVADGTLVGEFGSKSSPPPQIFAGRRATKRWPPRCESVSSQCQWREGRRFVSISLVLAHFFCNSNYAVAGSIFDKYVKKKKLDPLVAYVPAVILSQMQIKDLEKTLEGEQPQFASCRSLLRSGPAASLRINIRAVAQYASESGNGKTASNDVDQCLRALEELDSLLLHASRNDPGASINSMKAQINVALDSLDGLLKTVPRDVLDKGLAIADSYLNSDEDESPSLDISGDPELEQLESIL